MTWNLRCVLLLGLTVACGGSFLVEQPSSSVLGEYFRMQWFTSLLRVTRLSWDMYTMCNGFSEKDDIGRIWN